jgi:hypothetical protein
MMSGDTGLDCSAPDGIEPIVGWRMWRVENHEIKTRSLARSDLKLCSMYNREAWLPRKPLEAACMRRGPSSFRRHGAVPQWFCSCGVYAHDEIDSLLPMWFLRAVPGPLSLSGAPSENPAESIRVVGEVSLWGKVIVHDDGYRAQYAYPRRLWVEKDSAESLVRALPAYGVPIGTTRDAELHRLIERRLDFMGPENKDPAIAFLNGEDWLPFSRWPR